jgi:hypothetical protein
MISSIFNFRTANKKLTPYYVCAMLAKHQTAELEKPSETALGMGETNPSRVYVHSNYKRAEMLVGAHESQTQKSNHDKLCRGQSTEQECSKGKLDSCSWGNFVLSLSIVVVVSLRFFPSHSVMKFSDISVNDAFVCSQLGQQENFISIQLLEICAGCEFEYTKLHFLRNL